MLTPPDRELLSLITDLARLSRIFQQDQAFCEGVTFTQFLILDAIAEAGGQIALSRLHTLLEVDKSTTTRLVAPLLKRELVTRRRSPDDGRAWELVMTGDGREVTADVWHCLHGTVTAIEARIPAEERTEVLRGVRTFLTALRAALINGECKPGGRCCCGV
jgi:DNA-binding MarR family transcriptional regulator